MSGDSCFANVVVQTAVHMLPSRLSSIRDGVQHYLNGLLMKYQPQLSGVVVSYDKLKVLEKQAAIFNERPHLHFDIQVRLLLFKPQVGSQVVGQVVKIEPDHIGLLIHGLFNCTVLSTQGLTNEYVYVAKDNKWHSDSLNSDITVGTRIRITITKLAHHMQILSFEGSMLQEDTGVVEK